MRLILMAVAFHFIFISVAMAGFEFLPSANKTPPRVVGQTSERPVSLAPQPSFAPAPVMAEPLMPPTRFDKPMAPPMTSNMTSEIRPPLSPPVPMMNNTAPSALVIDPYPLRGNQGATQNSYAPEYVATAMAEETRILNPLQLGGGMTTGVQKPQAVKRVMAPPAPAPRPPAVQKFTSNSMTPMMGGEPAPLPGIIPSNVSPRAMNYADAVGFGRDLPLALALSQILPDGYSPIYEDGVDAGTAVSWQGGKPWNMVLNGMLSPQNMMAMIQGNNVVIRPVKTL